MLKRSRVSLGDIAKETGVSATTVSRVLNRREGEVSISARTRQVVIDTANRLGYQRNELALAIRSGRTGLIGAITRSVSGSMGSVMLHELQKQAQSRGVEVLSGLMPIEEAGAERQLLSLQQRLFDGYIVLGEPLNIERTVDALAEAGKTTVCLGRDMAPRIPSVATDTRVGIELMFDHVFEAGHRDIAFLSIAGISTVAEMRKKYVELCGQRGIEPLVLECEGLSYKPEQVDYITRLPAFMEQFAVTLMQRPELPTAIMCAADGLAAGLTRAFPRLGVRVPDDLSITGFDDSREAIWSMPSLTTVRHPIEELAGKTLDILIGENADSAKDTIWLPPKVVERNSLRHLAE